MPPLSKNNQTKLTTTLTELSTHNSTRLKAHSPHGLVTLGGSTRLGIISIIISNIAYLVPFQNTIASAIRQFHGLVVVVDCCFGMMSSHWS